MDNLAKRLADARYPEAIRRELARRHLDRKWLAHASGISLSQLDKLLSGQRSFSLDTRVRIEQALGLRFDQLEEPAPAAAPSVHSDVAPPELGAYTRRSVQWMMRDFRAVRPMVDGSGRLLSYRTRIFWVEAAGHLAFREDNRPPGWLSHSGDVSLPSESGHVYLLTRCEGQYRLAILCRRAGGVLSGHQLTLAEMPDGQLAPATFPLALTPIIQGPEEPSLDFGIFPATDHRVSPFLRHLQAAAGDDR